MKEVLISIQPKWCELIANGKKTVEVRKTRPKIETPFKCYIYCTRKRVPIRDTKYKVDGKFIMYYDELAITDRYGQGKRFENPYGVIMEGETSLNGKVIGEFVCDYILQFTKDDYDSPYDISDDDLSKTCLRQEDLYQYGKGKTLYGWHISDLVIYDDLKELETFTTFCDANKKRCANCKHYLFDNDDLNGYRRWCGVYHRKPLTRPPQSWCYVEGRKDR